MTTRKRMMGKTSPGKTNITLETLATMTVQQTQIKTDWLYKFFGRSHHWIMGRCGQTHLMLVLLSYRAQQKPKSLTFIGDITYGTPSGSYAEIPANNWLDINPDHVYITVPEIANMVKTVVEATEAKDGFSGLNERIKLGRDAATEGKTLPEYPPIDVYVHEWNWLLSEIASHPEYEFFLPYISKIINDGRGHKIQLCLAGQHCRIFESGISSVQRRQFNFIAVGNGATDRQLLSDIPGAKPNELIKDAQAIKSEGAGWGACVVKFSDEAQAQAQVMPHINLDFKF